MLKRIKPMPNVPLAYVSVYRRMSDIFHTLVCASTIRNSVTGPLADTFSVSPQRQEFTPILVLWQHSQIYKVEASGVLKYF
jgi:hypothetical protein